MIRLSPRRPRLASVLHHVASFALILLIGLFAGCRQQAQHARAPRPIDGSHVEVVAWLDADSPCHQGTIEVLKELEEENPERLDVRIVDTGTPEGFEQRKERGYDAVAIEIDGYTTVEWGQGDDRRIVTFMHPAGFTWNHADLREATEAALAGELRPANPAEAEGVRLMDIAVRGQSIRVGDEGRETGQLVLQDQIVLEITQPRDDLLPGQRVAVAADALSEVLQNPFTPNQLRLGRLDDAVAVMADDRQLLVATKADAAGQETTPRRLAERWRLAVREALIDAAIQRPTAAEAEPMADQPDIDENATANPLLPTE